MSERHTYKITKCESCNKINLCEYAPCPYNEEINGDSTPVSLCDNCRHERAMDI